MIDGYTAAYASISYVSQASTFSLSSQQNTLSSQQNTSGGDSVDSVSASGDYSGLSFSYSTTTTVTTVSLLYVQESANSNNTQNDNGGNGQSALDTVLAGPTDPFNPLDASTPVTNTALDIINGTISSSQSGDNDGDDGGNGNGVADGDGDDFNSGSDQGDKAGHARNTLQAAYSVTRSQVSTTTVEFSLVA